MPGRPEGTAMPAVSPDSESIAVKNLSDLLTEHPAAPETEIVQWPSGSASAAEVAAGARALAVLLGDVRSAPVACLVDRGIDAVIAMFGIWLAGGVYVPVNARLPEAELRRQLAAHAPALVVAGAAQADRIPAECNRAVALESGEWSV